GGPARLELAERLWPWDSGWRTEHVERLIASGALPAATKLAQRRQAAWPDDPESFTAEAVVQEAAGDIPHAERSLARALTETQDGRCVPSAVERYRSFLAR